MNDKEIKISVRRSGIWMFDVVIHTGNVDNKKTIQSNLDNLLQDPKAQSWIGSVFPWTDGCITDPYAAQNFQREFIHTGMRFFSGEVKDALKLLNKWVDGVEKAFGKKCLTIEYDKA